MGITVGQFKESLTAELHGGTLSKVRNVEAMLERAANTMLMKVDPIDTERIIPLTQAVHDQVYNYTLATDYKKIIDLYPQDNRTFLDSSHRKYARAFDLKKAFAEKTISVESSEGTKFLRINWPTVSPKLVNAMDSTTANGTWTAITGASGLVADALYKITGSASLRFNLTASGGGLQNTTMQQIDLSSWDEEADFFIWFYFPAVSALTSITGIWGNDLTTNYWTSVAQTAQADGTAFKIGWNLIRFPWSTASETGTVVPTAIDSFKFTIQSTGAISNVRTDNIVVSLGRMFDMKYYSKYILKNSAGTWISRTTTDDDVIVLDSDAIQLYHLETLIAAAQQVEGSDSSFDITFANRQLHGDPTAVSIEGRLGLYRLYKGENPSQSKKATNRWFSPPRFRGRSMR